MKIEIWPAIDIIDGQCVRLTKGAYDSATTYYKDPCDAALLFEDCGATKLHLVDLDGAKASHPVNLNVLECIKRRTALEVEFGGGVKSEIWLQRLFDAGADWVICGSIAVTSPEQVVRWIETWKDRIVLGADARNGCIAVNGWLEDADITLDDLLQRYSTAGLKRAVCTDIGRDGMLCGPSVDMYIRLQSLFPSVDITVSGGISSVDDIINLDNAGLRKVIVGKAFYEGRITPKQLVKCLQRE